MRPGSRRPARTGGRGLLAAVALAAALTVVVPAASAPLGAATGRPPAQTGTGTTVAPAQVVTGPPSTTTPPGPGPVPTASTTSAAAGGGGGRPRPVVAHGAVALVDQTDWLAEGEPFDLRVAVGAGVGEDASIVLDLHPAVTSRSQFAATLGGQLLGSRRAEVVVPLAELTEQPDGSRRIRLTQAATDVPGERSIRPLTRPGVYPLVVGLRDEGDDAEPPAPFTTYLVRTPAQGTTPLQVAVVQPVGAPLARQPDGSTVVGDEALASLGSLAQVLASSVGTPLTLQARPETLEALGVVATSDDEGRAAAAGGVLKDLRAAVEGRQVVSEPWVDLRLDALVATGLGEDLAAQRRRGDAALEAALDVRGDVRTWVSDEGLAGPSLRRLADIGVDQVVLPDAALSPVELRLSLSRPFALVAGAGAGGETLAASAPEPALAARYEAEDPVLGAQHALADLAVLHGDEPGPLRARGVVVAPPPGVESDPGFLTALLTGLATSPVLDPVTLEGYFGDVDPQEGDDGEPLVRTVSPTGGRLGITAADVAAARSTITGFASMVTGESEVVRALDDRTLLAEAEGLEVAGRRAFLQAVADDVAQRVGSVGVVEAASVRLADSEGTVPLTIVRDGTDPLAVRVTLESEQLSFGPERRPGRFSYDLELTRENTPLVVPVQVRSPGTFPLLVTITSPDGLIEVGRAQVTIRSTAFSGVGVALSVGAGFFLLLWWGRHWRTVRRARRLVPIT